MSKVVEIVTKETIRVVNLYRDLNDLIDPAVDKYVKDKFPECESDCVWVSLSKWKFSKDGSEIIITYHVSELDDNYEIFYNFHKEIVPIENIIKIAIDITMKK